MTPKNIFHRVLTLTLLAAGVAAAAQTVNLPTIKVQGKEYYYYRVKKSESPYGISKKYGWNEDTLRSVNSNMGAKIAKGQTIYYPVHTDASGQTPVIGKIEPVSVKPEPVTHTVTRGESVYTISRLYSVPIDLIYSANPEARHGLRPGQKLSIVQPVYQGVGSSSPFYYTVRQGDTLANLAETFNTDVVSLMRENPGMTERSLTAGDNIRVIPNNRKVQQVTETREIVTVSGFTPYKVLKNDSWESIAQANNIKVADLMLANDATDLPKKGSWIVIPQYKSEKLKAIVETPVAAETTQAEREEIYRTIHNVDSISLVNVTVVLDKPTAKNNSEFLRGFLMGVDKQKNSGSKIHLSVVDASKGIANANADSVLKASNLIIGVYDSEFPAYLADLGRQNGIEVVNVLDSKSEFFESNPSMVQLIQPINYFNDLSVSYIHDKHPQAQLILLGDIDTGDKFADVLTDTYSPDVTTRLSLEEFAVYPFSAIDEYVVYCYPLKKDDVSGALEAVSTAQTAGISIVPVGRAQWVAFARPLAELYGQTGVLVPSRMYFSPYDADQKAFGELFKSIYQAAPYASYPQYAMLGYDVASYFIPTTAGNGGDYNRGVRMRPGLQNDIDIKRLNNWSGFINTNAYILHYMPEQIIEKIEIQ